MAKDPSPLLGYNNNIRHKNRVFHIQTEDSGVRHPHIITHLFMDGGRILKSVKTSYAEHLGVDKFADLVRKMMKDQHKGMLIALRDGQFDPVIEGGDAPRPVPKPSESAAAVPSPTAAPVVEAHAPPAPPPAHAPPAPAPPAPAPPAPAQPAPAPLATKAFPRIPVERVDSAEFESPSAKGPKSGADLPFDMQPPPDKMFRPRTGGNYSEVANPPSAPGGKVSPTVQGRPVTRPPPSARSTSVAPGALISKSAGLKAPVGAPAGRPPPLRRGSSPPPPPAGPPPFVSPSASRRPATSPTAVSKESRYASARPAAIFGQARPRGGSSIFGEDIISDKSLDEVIMSYLADDGPAKGSEGGAKPSTGQASDPKRRR